jgi:hypothetical protein
MMPCAGDDSRQAPTFRLHEQVSDDGEAVRSISSLKRFAVFNVAQCDGLPERLTIAPAPPAKPGCPDHFDYPREIPRGPDQGIKGG